MKIYHSTRFSPFNSNPSPFPSAMAVLKDLTDEFLVEVVKFLACDKTTLHSLATVYKKLNGLATQILARDVDIYVHNQDQGKQDVFMVETPKLCCKFPQLLSPIIVTNIGNSIRSEVRSSEV